VKLRINLTTIVLLVASGLLLSLIACKKKVEIEVWEDSTSGLAWQVFAPGVQMSWPEAKSHCDSLTLDGQSDWRLPSISELRSLIRGCDVTQKDGPCKVNDSCLKLLGCRNRSCDGCSIKDGPGLGGTYLPQALKGNMQKYWSSSACVDANRNVWFVEFEKGFVGFDTDSSDGLVRCVRTPPEKQ
jgi:Protein of unknown function (DUF1566)